MGSLNLGPGRFSRRSAFGVGLGILAGHCRASGLYAQKQPAEREEAVLQTIRDRFGKAGLPEPRVMPQGRFVAVTTATREFVKRILRMAEDTSAGYVRFVGGCRLPVNFGSERLAIVILANAGQYSKFNGEQKARNEGGHYDIDENWTVTFDHRGRSRSTRSDLERANMVTMIHEITHQLSFDTGLLSRDADVPMLISEGLATLAEPSGASTVPGFSEVNRPRVAVMEQLLRAKRSRWIPLQALIEADEPFDAPDDATLQMAYSQAWLFWDSVTRQSRLREKLGPYLDRVNSRRNPARRVDDFVAAFGSVRSVEDEMALNWNALTKS
jgi:hypothetical protein